jgi:hypothetical protein
MLTLAIIAGVSEIMMLLYPTAQLGASKPPNAFKLLAFDHFLYFSLKVNH